MNTFARFLATPYPTSKINDDLDSRGSNHFTNFKIHTKSLLWKCQSTPTQETLLNSNIVT